MEFNALNLDIRDINACVRTGCKTVEELKQRIADDPEGIRRQLGFATFDRVEDAIVELSDDPEALPQPVVIHENLEAHARACYLRDDTKARISVIDENFYAVCNNIKEMRDGKLYKELGYQNFEDCCKTEFGIARTQAYKYINIVERLPEDFVHSSEQIGVQKLSLLAMLDEPTRETVIETVDVESATVKELKAQITALTAERDENEHAAALLSEELDSAKESILEKESRIRELENQPVQHDITDVDSAAEIERLKKELEDEQLRVMIAEKSAESKARRAADEARHELTQMHETELQTLKDGYERQLAEAQKSDADHAALEQERFEALRVMFEHAVDELENFLEDVQSRKERIGFIKNLDKYFRDAILDQIDD